MRDLVRKYALPCLLAAFVLASCNKNENRVRVVKDCTGSYLQLEDGDYRVCNSDILSQTENETYVKVSYYEVNECNEMDDEIVCFMHHEHKGLVKITSLD